MPEGLRNVDANLLLALHALLEERNLTRAGTRLSMSQPAMSGALARLRKHLGDELLVRTGRGFELTPRAEQLRPLVAEAVAAAEIVLEDQREFDPLTSTKRFDLSMSEYAMTVLSEPLNRLIREQAPGCSVSFDSVPVSRQEFENQLSRRDLIVVPLGFGLPGETQPIFTDELVCLVSRGNPNLRDGGLSLEDLAAMPHAVAEFLSAGEWKRPLEVELERRGLSDRVVVVDVTSLLTLPFAVAGTDICAFVPARLARRCVDMLDLVIADTPLEPVWFTEAAHWHPRRTDDPAVGWLRRLLYDVAVDVESDE